MREGSIPSLLKGLAKLEIKAHAARRFNNLIMELNVLIVP